MATNTDLATIIDRLKWSWDHMERLKLAMVQHGVAYHWAAVPHVQTQTGKYIDFVVDGVTPLPDHFKFLIGDCIHSLRASLDNLIYLFCPTDRSEFLICKTRDHWKRNAWKIKALPKDPYKALYDLQPFNMQDRINPSGHPLVILNDLWNADKHRSPHVATGVTDTAWIDYGDAEIWPIYNSGPLDLGSVIARVWLISEPEPDLIPDFSFDVVFDPLGPGRGWAAYPYLADLHHTVGDIVEVFRQFCV